MKSPCVTYWKLRTAQWAMKNEGKLFCCPNLHHSEKYCYHTQLKLLKHQIHKYVSQLDLVLFISQESRFRD